MELRFTSFAFGAFWRRLGAFISLDPLIARRGALFLGVKLIWDTCTPSHGQIPCSAACSACFPILSHCCPTPTACPVPYDFSALWHLPSHDRVLRACKSRIELQPREAKRVGSNRKARPTCMWGWTVAWLPRYSGSRAL